MSRTQSRITLVCYDISSNKLRRKIDRCMKDFGVRFQYSVYLCRLDKDDAELCRRSLQKVLDKYNNEKQPSDSLILLERLNPSAASCLLGAGFDSDAPSFMII